MAFSYSGLIEQLEYEGFSTAEATYAADHCGADWNEQAYKSAVSYLQFMSFSKSGLIEQLEYEGFTYEQAVYGVNKAYNYEPFLIEKLLEISFIFIKPGGRDMGTVLLS